MNHRTWMGVVAVLAGAPALATPSTQVWIPSTDVQPFGVVHLNYDIYARLADETNGTRKPTVLVLGPTVGVLPLEKLKFEVGFDLMFQGDSALDANPLYLHAKVGTPEDALFKWSPAIAAGVYNFGLGRGVTNQDIGYALVGRTLPWVGRLSAGYFYGNRRLLVDEHGEAANHGLLLSWDRALPEISKKLWVGVDFQGGRSSLAAASAGVGWAFTDQIGVITGYDHYLNRAAGGRDTFTVQLDVNL